MCPKGSHFRECHPNCESGNNREKVRQLPDIAQEDKYEYAKWPEHGLSRSPV